MTDATIPKMNLRTDNIIRTYIYMAVLTALVMMLAYVLSDAAGYGSTGVSVGLIIAGAINFIAYYFSDRIVIAQSGAQLAQRAQEPRYYEIGERLARRANLPMPALYIIPDIAPNAFATGRDPDHASVAATRGLLESLDDGELEGVIAHEMSHITNYDMRLMSTVAILVGMINILTQMMWYGGRGNRYNREDRTSEAVQIILMMLTPIVGLILQLAISRQREYLADAGAANLSGSPDGLIRALTKMAHHRHSLSSADISTAPLYITNPWGDDSVFSRLFSTHPPLAERIKRLKTLRSE